jgi:hypothetical protein
MGLRAMAQLVTDNVVPVLAGRVSLGGSYY